MFFSPESKSVVAEAVILNRECFCITLDRAALCRAVEQAVGDPDFCATFIGPRLHLFAGTAVFAAERHLEQMQRVVRGIEAAARLPGYRAAALSWAPEIAQPDHGPLGAFMGYDFHVAADGPRLIEVNINAGGAFVNALLVGAQRSCCPEVRSPSSGAAAVDFDLVVLRLFQAEWARQRRTGALRRIAIVDDRPAEQFLYPEFILAQRLLTRQGVATVIADAAELRYEHGRLSFICARAEPAPKASRLHSVSPATTTRRRKLRVRSIMSCSPGVCRCGDGNLTGDATSVKGN